jgi:hypothetical protein
MATRFEKQRFHVNYGPNALFERVKYKMSGVKSLKLHGRHFIDRIHSRNINEYLQNKIYHFSSADWNLVAAEVRVDSGKFVNSTWELVHEGVKYWIVIGFGNTVETVMIKESSGLENVCTQGILYDFVSSVNSELMLQEKLGETE